MGKRLVLIAFALSACLASPATAGPPIASWEDAWHLIPDRPPRPKPIEPDGQGAGPFRMEPAVPIERPEVIPSPPAAAPVPARVVDAWGQAWAHADRAYLEAWVAQRNAFAVPRARQQAQWAYPNGAVCPNGNCPRR